MTDIKEKYYRTAVVVKDGPFFKKGTVVAVEYTNHFRRLAVYTARLGGREQIMMMENFHLTNFVL